MNDSARTKAQLGILLMMVRWIMHASWWGPIVYFSVHWAAHFDHIFEPLSENGELPALTACLLGWSHINKTTFYLPAFVVLLMMVAVDWVLMRFGLSTEKNVWPWLWLVGVSVGSIFAVLLVVLALTLPVFRMSEPIQ